MDEDIGLDLERFRDLRGRDREPWIRRTGLSLLVLIPVAALLNTFGQAPEVATATGPGVRLSVEAPEAGRGGLIFQVRITVDASSAIREPTLVLSESWLEGLTLNTIEPSPTDEKWGPDGLVFTFPPIQAGEQLKVFLQYQVNPTTVERRDQRVEIRDGATPLAHVDRVFTVYP
jgi:hypothetical protein